jgi:hypothetical protein
MAFNLTKLVGGVVTLQSTIVPKGAYNGDTIYIAGDSVSYNGKSYVAIQPTQGNLPTDTDYWQLLCDSGSGSSTFLELTDTPSAYTSQALKGVRVNSGENALEFFDIPASGTDELVKFDAGDPTAGYLADKVIAGTGISVAEGTEANENKLVVSSTITQATRDSLGLDTDDTVTFANLSGTNTGDQESSDFDIKDLTDSTNLKTTWSGKQDPLIAGTDYDVPLTFSTGLTRTGNTITNDITQYEDSDAVSAIKADEDWNASDWDTAYSWGNHASAGYLKDINSESIGDLEDVDLTDIANGKILKYNSTSENWECEDDAGGMTNPMTTAGDIIYGGADGTPTRLAKGTASQVLKMNSGATAPEWADESGGGTWGSITGTLSSQTDLQNALDDKQSIDETQTLTDGETVSWNMANGSCGILTLGGNRALANPTNIQAGRTYTLIVKQDANGSRELTFGNGFRFPGSTEPVLSSTASAVDILQFFAESTSVLHLTNFISDSKA